MQYFYPMEDIVMVVYVEDMVVIGRQRVIETMVDGTMMLIILVGNIHIHILQIKVQQIMFASSKIIKSH